MMRIALWVLAMSIGANAFADTLIYTYTGTGSGSIGSTSFSGASFTISQTMDTTNKMELFGGDVFAIEATSAEVSIAGVGTYSFVTPTRTYHWLSNGSVGFSRGISAGGLDLYGSNGGVPGLIGWSMTTPIGPVTHSFGLIQWGVIPVQTSGGVLTFNTSNITGTFQASAVATSVPEPTELSIALLSITSFLLVRKRAGRN